ncbi:NAD-dependent dihydropyrimidine dehydrogenase, PreA subunit [Clostridium cavendishii DSM 21758]|uniref:NAD-dependent dihydropyrimidine dehydrogenase, PreA subunit n=1 Tax=Clostridium cavendishii DSM 21758 TaxID=1121302 RepID=A0A1M6AIU4_9CLOT|nr:EFR1 family ferrodoxin [Clostridium cavendishii]SHI36347.1 NAD-dependent dihydropyrimidine dehydrogenase, PreA subunit [Clostridium cavendishii DSM 21758]
MQTKIFYFSSTGNSLYVAKKVKESLGNGDIISIPKSLRNKDFNIDADIIGFIYPIHVSSLPIVVEEFISKITINKNAYIFAIGVTGGGEAKSSFPHINSLLGNQGELSNYLCLKYISNYIRAGRNASEERALKAIEQNEPILNDFIKEIKIKQIKKVTYKQGLNKIAYNFWKNKYKTKDKNFNVNEACIGCRICEKICPVNNIKFSNNKPIWLGNCTDCMACINLCPKEAINIGTKTLKKNRYKNPFIKVEELL